MVVAVKNLKEDSYSGYIYAYFDDNGFIIKYPTAWIKDINSLIGTYYGKKSVNQYFHSLKSLLSWIEEKNLYKGLSIDETIKILTRRDLEIWVGDLRGELNPRTIKHYELVAKVFFDWLTTDSSFKIREFDTSPYKSDKLITRFVNKKLPRYISVEELILILNNYHNESERCFVHALFDMGLRKTEAIEMKIQDLPSRRLFPDGIKYFPILVRGVKGRTDTEKERYSFISSALLARIEKYHNTREYRDSPFWSNNDPDKPMFLTVRGNKLTASGINKQMESAAIRAKLDPKKVTPHRMRHGAAYSILRSDLGKDYMDNLLIMGKNFGHASVRSSEPYLNIPPSLLIRLNGDSNVNDRYEESKRISEATYLAPRKHKEKRGHWENE